MLDVNIYGHETHGSTRILQEQDSVDRIRKALEEARRWVVHWRFYRRFGRRAWNSKVYVIKKWRHWRVFLQVYRFFFTKILCKSSAFLYASRFIRMKQASNQTVFLIDQIPGAKFGNGAVDAVAVFFCHSPGRFKMMAARSTRKRTERKGPGGGSPCGAWVELWH